MRFLAGPELVEFTVVEAHTKTPLPECQHPQTGAWWLMAEEGWKVFFRVTRHTSSTDPLEVDISVDGTPIGATWVFRGSRRTEATDYLGADEDEHTVSALEFVRRNVRHADGVDDDDAVAGTIVVGVYACKDAGPYADEGEAPSASWLPYKGRAVNTKEKKSDSVLVARRSKQTTHECIGYSDRRFERTHEICRWKVHYASEFGLAIRGMHVPLEQAARARTTNEPKAAAAAPL
jgi:hypothetical protein